jgi:4-hydroxybenzoyl-CoA thioesterase
VSNPYSQGEIPEFVRGDHYVHRRDFVVEWGHCDPAGIVFNPRFHEYFDWSCVLLLQAATELTKSQLHDVYNLKGIPIVSTQAKFVRPITYDDEVAIYSAVVGVKRSSMDFRHCLTKAGQVSVECSQTRVWCVPNPENPDRPKSSPIPTEVVNRLI